jgi:hypothetical protein
MFDKETRWFIRCDTCPDDDANTSPALFFDKDDAAKRARKFGWSIRDDLHRCPPCIEQGRTERAS